MADKHKRTVVAMALRDQKRKKCVTAVFVERGRRLVDDKNFRRADQGQRAASDVVAAA